MSVGSLKDYSFKTNSLYFIHNWEIFDQATRSNVEALSTYYQFSICIIKNNNRAFDQRAYSMIVLHMKNFETMQR